MTNPVPGYGVSTAYGKRGSYWSCNRDASGKGIHTGVDYAAPTGTRVVAARPGTAVYCNYGSAFGGHQLAVKAGDGTRDFYAHMTTRSVANGAKVNAGDTVGKVGAEGNVTGPHLHFERHATETGGWSCSVVRDPAPSINYAAASGSGGSGSGTGKDDDMPKYAHAKIAKPIKLKAGAWTPIPWDSGPSGVVTPGNPGIAITGPYIATLYLRVIQREGATVITDTVEWANDKAQETNAPVTHDRDYLGDTRQGNVQSGRRLRFRVKCDKAATVDNAAATICYWS